MNSCPCHSEKPYDNCCKPFHEGLAPPTPLLLMRSRYAAYAKHLVDYIIKTTHPDNPLYQKDHQRWKKDLLLFSQNTSYEGLDIIEWEEGEKIAYVTFKAHLKHKGQEASFTEKSQFKREDGRWLYSGYQHLTRSPE